MKKPVIIWDLDGTLSCGQHRLHLLPTRDTHLAASWFDFNKACFDDAPIADNIALCNTLCQNYHTIILTGRSDVAKAETIRWLQKHRVRYSRLIMRKCDDDSKDIEFKEAWLRHIGLDSIQCCFDDLEHVVKHIRSLGITCHQVTHYDTPKRHVMPQCDHAIRSGIPGTTSAKCLNCGEEL